MRSFDAECFAVAWLYMALGQQSISAGSQEKRRKNSFSQVVKSAKNWKF